MTIDRATVTAMARAGIKFLVSIPTVWGATEEFLAPADVPAFMDNPEWGRARLIGAQSVQEYDEWLETGGTALCAAKNKRGRPCGQSVGGGCQLGFEHWRSLHRQQYCTVHGEGID
jgi:hypothetical protein